MLREQHIASETPMASGSSMTSEDPNVRFSIPNETIIRRSLRSTSAKQPTGITPRNITFRGSGSHVRYAVDLPFKPRGGLKWKGAPAVTGSQLTKEAHAKKKRKSNNDDAATS